MTFGDYQYGPEDDDGETTAQPDRAWDPLIEVCAHPWCDEDTPDGDRLCDDCVAVMLPANRDRCPHCGVEA